MGIHPSYHLKSANWLPTPLLEFVNKWNNQKFAKSIQGIIAQLGFKDLMLFCDSDMFRSSWLKEILKPNVFIYYTRDNLMTVPYWKKHGEKNGARNHA